MGVAGIQGHRDAAGAAKEENPGLLLLLKKTRGSFSSCRKSGAPSSSPAEPRGWGGWICLAQHRGGEGTRSIPAPHSRLGIPAWGDPASSGVRGCCPQLLPGFSLGKATSFLCSPTPGAGTGTGGDSSADQGEVAPVPPRYLMALFPGADDTTTVATPFPRWLLSLSMGTSEPRNYKTP